MTLTPTEAAWIGLLVLLGIAVIIAFACCRAAAIEDRNREARLRQMNEAAQ